MCKNDSLLTVTRIQFIVMQIVIRMFFKNVQSSGYAKLETGDRSSANVLQTGRWVTIQVVTWMLQTQRSSATNTLIFKNLKLSKLLHQSTVPIVVSAELSVEKQFVYNFLLSSEQYTVEWRDQATFSRVSQTLLPDGATHTTSIEFLFSVLSTFARFYFIFSTLLNCLFSVLNLARFFSFFYSQPTWFFSSTYLDLYCFFICYSPLSSIFYFLFSTLLIL